MLVQSEIREAHAIALFRQEQVMFQEDLERVILKNLQDQEISPQLELNALVDELANHIEATNPANAKSQYTYFYSFSKKGAILASNFVAILASQ